jgi:L,D-peptidoglycan transpeptidase YkuD (ErfK/YbiS/YcfS/YnhG family)
MKIRPVLATLSVCALTVAGLVVPSLISAAPAGASTIPHQVITVQSNTTTSTTARLDLWQLAATGGYTHVAGPISAFVGELGVGKTHDNVARTPAGVFSLTQSFGNQPAYTGTKMPYFQAGSADWWDGEAGTPAYNTHVHQSASPGSESENLYYAGFVYSHAVVIDYNRFPAVAGAGAAFFLHVTNNEPTAGCVAVSAFAMKVIQLWLNPALHPVISIGVGAAALRPVSDANKAAAAHNPRGHLDSVTISGRTAKVTGWAADPDSAANPLQVSVYFDGKFRGHYYTGVARPDVAAAIHTGPKQGFSINFPTVAPGRRTICVYALNIKLGTANPSLGCAVRTVS